MARPREGLAEQRSADVAVLEAGPGLVPQRGGGDEPEQVGHGVIGVGSVSVDRLEVIRHAREPRRMRCQIEDRDAALAGGQLRVGQQRRHRCIERELVVDHQLREQQ
jgi:hypothetical protein